jgi:hypothetical protein
VIDRLLGLPMAALSLYARLFGRQQRAFRLGELSYAEIVDLPAAAAILVEAELAIARGHSTSTMAAQTALEAGAKRLVLTHLSPRYLPGNPITPDDLLAEARAIFPLTEVARDFLAIDVVPEEPDAAA